MIKERNHARKVGQLSSLRFFEIMSVQLRKSGASYFKDYVASNNAVLKNLFQQKGFINGAWVNAKSGKTFDVTDPATGEVIGTCPEMGVDDTQEAVESAKVKLFYFFPPLKNLKAKGLFVA